MELCRVLICVVDWGRRASTSRYTLLLRIDTMSQCSYSSLLAVTLTWRQMSVSSANVKELCGAELCGGLLPQNKCTPLHYAARNGQSEPMQLLLTAKANADAADRVRDLPSVE